MKYPGQPRDTDPDWYRPRPASHIEDAFSKAAADWADAIEAERWFGDAEKHHRYRVDFLLKDARLIVELDGHEHHSTPEQLEKDAARQRYLTRAGYTVIRFRGREIYRNPNGCAAEVRRIYLERVQRSPARYRAFYIDYRFVYRQTAETIRYLKAEAPGRSIRIPDPETVMIHALSWLHERSHVTAFIFVEPDDEDEILYLDGVARDFATGDLRFNVVRSEFWHAELIEHLESYSHLYDDISMVGDDRAYIGPLLHLLTPDNGKLIRRSSEKTAYRDTDLMLVRWQDIHYVICGAAGLEPHEM